WCRLAHPAGPGTGEGARGRVAAGEPGPRHRRRGLGADRAGRAGRAGPRGRPPARVQPRPRGAAEDGPDGAGAGRRARRLQGARARRPGGGPGVTPVARRVGVVVMAYGSPASLDDVPAYYTHIRRGRPPTDEQIEDLLARYRAIGGTSPLAERTRAQVARIAAALEARDPGRFVVELGQKHAAPFIEDAVGALAAAGVGHVVGLVLTPHYSAASVGQYHERAAAT